MSCPLPVAFEVCRVRGDTFPIALTVVDEAGDPIDVTVATDILLTVDPSRTPVDDTNNLFQLTGAVVDGPTGKIEFAITALQADQTPGRYFYDVQLDLGDGIRTVLNGTFRFQQDITKA